MLMRENEKKMLSVLMTSQGTQITVKMILRKKPLKKTLLQSLIQ